MNLLPVLFRSPPARSSGTALARDWFNDRMLQHVEAEINAQYESGQRYSTRRSYIPGQVRDARFDADSATRYEIVRKSRYFERNSALLNRLCDLFEQFTIGPNGLKILPNSSDPEWNAIATEWLDEWYQFCDLTTLQPWGTVQSLSARTWAIDGECFMLKTYGKPRLDQQAFPRIQLLETHNIATPPHLFGDVSVDDGIQLDKKGRPVGYWIREQTGMYGQETYTYVDSQWMIHIGEPSRIGMRHSLPFTYPVLNKLHDRDDLDMLQMDKATENAAKTAIIKTASGQLSGNSFMKTRLRLDGDTGTSGGSSNERTEYYKEIFKSRAMIMRHGDEYQEHVTQSPSVVEESYNQRLDTEICAGFGISRLLVYPLSIQGTVARADLDVMAHFFKSRSAILADKFTQAQEFALGWAKDNVPALYKAPKDWRKFKVRPPRSVNVDVGRNSVALISEYIAGFRTLESICGELGEDWTEVLDQRAREFKMAAQIEKSHGLIEGQLIQATLDAISATAQNAVASQPAAGGAQ